MTLRNVPQLKDASRIYAVNRPNQHEGLYQPVYDFQTYPAAGATQFLFFQIPKGQGGKTLSDTNMEAAGQFPSPKHYLCYGLEVVFFPSATLIAQSGLAAASMNADFIRDTYTFHQAGYLELFVGSKTYLYDAPVGAFPPCFRLGGFATNAITTAADTNGAEIAYAVTTGKPYEISPVFIPATQNFSVSLNYAAAVPLPSTVDARVGVRMLGFQYRLSQ